MPFPLFHIIFQSGAAFVVGFFLSFYFGDRGTEVKFQLVKPTPLSPPVEEKLLNFSRFSSKSLPLPGEEDSITLFLSETTSFPSSEGIKGWVKPIQINCLQTITKQKYVAS